MTSVRQLVVVSDATSTAIQALRGEVYRFVLRRVGNEAAAEDIVQEALVRAYSRLATLEDPAKARSWLYQIIRHAVIDHYRAKRPTEPIPDDLLSPDAEQEDRARRELAGCLAPLLDDLPETYREALRLADFEGATQQAVADRLGLSLSGAKSRVQRGRALLGEALANCCRVEVDRRGSVVGYEPVGTCNCCSDHCGT
jgi:RNA polymerase sigma-70 factor, ECF subfamily